MNRSKFYENSRGIPELTAYGVIYYITIGVLTGLVLVFISHIIVK